MEQLTKYVYNDEGRQFVAVYVSGDMNLCHKCASLPEFELAIIGRVVDYQRTATCHNCGRVIAEVQG